MLGHKKNVTKLSHIHKATFFEHMRSLEYKDNRKGYIDLLINKMLPAISKNKLAHFIDVFCETGYFTVAETEH
jgi:imidazolonepropionase